MTALFEVFDQKFFQTVRQDGTLGKVAEGFEFLEGPVWHPVRKDLIFSDIIGNTMYRWTSADGISIFRKPSHMANGNTLDREGRLLTCEHATSRVTRTEADGSITVLASHFKGKALNSPNDIIVRHDGCIYFTDPEFGRRSRVGVPRLQELPFQAVYRLDTDTQVLSVVADDFENPNGLCWSLGGRRLFVNDTPRQHIRVFDMAEDGSLSGGGVWAELQIAGIGGADGMKIDSQGTLYCCGPGGIHLFDQDAHCLGIIKMPFQTANFTWGDDDLRSLYICASTTLLRLRVNIPGISLLKN